MDGLSPNPALYGLPFTTDEFRGMPYRVLGRSGLRVANIGLGTWKMGHPETGDRSRVNEAAAMKILDRAVEIGVTHWDTANRYNNASGNSERIIGKWFRANPDQRRNVVLATKVFGGMDGVTPNHSRASRGNVIDSVHASLVRLQLDYIDLLYFHAFDAETPVEESLCAVEDLIRQGLVRYFAVSNFSVDQLRQYRAAEASVSARVRVLAVQNQFDILNGESANLHGVLDFAARNGISFVAWSPLARGLLTDRYLDPRKAGAGDRLFDEGTLSADATGQKIERIRRLAELAGEWDLSLNQVALAYMLTLPGMGPLIPSATTVEQLASNAAAGKANLSAEQLAKIRDVLGG